MPAKPVSLKNRALAFLALREHSRLELGRKLTRHSQDEAEIEAVLNELEQKDLLSSERFVQAYVRHRASKFGRAKIAAELSQHEVPADLLESALGVLSKEQQLEQIKAIWHKKFQPPSNLQEQLKQSRFFMSRGFDAELVRQWLRECAKARAE